MAKDPRTATEPIDGQAAAHELADALTALANYIEAARRQSSDAHIALTKADEQIRRAGISLARLRAAIK